MIVGRGVNGVTGRLAGQRHLPVIVVRAPHQRRRAGKQHPRERRFVNRDLNERALARPLPLKQRGKDSGRGVHRGADVSHQ